MQAVALQAAYRRAEVNRSGLPPADLLALQRKAGNRFVQDLVQRRGPAPKTGWNSNNFDSKSLNAAPASVNAGLALRGLVLRWMEPSGGRRAASLVQRAWSDADPGTYPAPKDPSQLPTPKGGWNTAIQTIGGVERIPIEGLTAGLQASTVRFPKEIEGEKLQETKESENGKAVAVVPTALKPGQSVEILLHLHGHNVGYRERSKPDKENKMAEGSVRDVATDRIEQQIEASGRNMIGILPQGTHKSGFGAFNAQAYIDEVWDQLVAMKKLLPDAKRGPVVLSGHSGAAAPISQILLKGNLPTGLGELVLFDAIHSGQRPPVERFLKTRMTDDVKKLKEIADPSLNGGLDAAAVTTQQTAYLAGSFRFRGIFTPKFHPQKVDANKKPIWHDPETKKKPVLDDSLWKGYGVEYEPLRDFIKNWIDSHTKGLSPTLVTALRGNYKVTPAGAGATHNTIMGANNNLQGALGALPVMAPAPLGQQPSQPQGQLQPPSTQPARIIQRQSVQQRSGRLVGSASGPLYNQREEVLQTMDRLHRLWSLSNGDYDAEYPRVSALATSSTVPQALIPLTVAAIQRNEEPTLHCEVARSFLNLALSANVGRGQTNTKTDVTLLQNALHALGRLPDAPYASEQAAITALPGATVTNADATIPATLAALTDLKKALAGGRLGWAPIHADEGEDAGDRFGGRTYEFNIFSIFLPRGARPDSNKVHIFFSPGDVQGESGSNAVLTHGLRGASDTSDWILIGVPGVEPGYNVITSADIAACLDRMGRSQSITSLRLSAHSRGYRGLRETVGRRLIPTTLVDRVVILDANYPSVASTLARSGISANKVIAYGVSTRNLALPGARNIRLPATGMRAIGYTRLIQDAMVTRPELRIPVVIRAQLLPLPTRGRFTTHTPPSAGQVNIVEFFRAHQAEINTIVRQEEDPVRGLKHFVDTNDLVRLGRAYSPGIYSHHFFVAEIAQEITD